VQLAAATHPRARIPRYLGPAALATLLGAVIVVIVTSGGGSETASNPAVSRPATVRKLPPYWTVRPGDTYTRIALKTGLTIGQLEAFNPHTGPLSLVVGQRLNLRRPPPPRPRPPAPRFWTVRRGESFGLIAAKTGISITTLEQLNARLKPTTLQPGDRVRLRR
jgi:LysM repeat protein